MGCLDRNDLHPGHNRTSDVQSGVIRREDPRSGGGQPWKICDGGELGLTMDTAAPVSMRMVDLCDSM
ncbi:unnamed protein product [Mesocestoides corti]|uniref:Ricin B lectin domain-containing protein n=1 Tax=Mesocestoides corti TaxID=53468 RepID=A0A0R3UQQ1_MESCO|nr:unnamed protein product [Mesocestoides corti]